MPFHDRGLAIPGKLDRWIGRNKADDEEEDYSQTNQRGNNPKSKKQDIKINNNKEREKSYQI